MSCTKRRYTSRAVALAAHRGAGYRIRVYECYECRPYFHTTNMDKNGVTDWEEVKDEHKKKRASQFLKLAPFRTLAELERIATEKRAKHAKR